jgi:hypothetical protein
VNRLFEPLDALLKFFDRVFELAKSDVDLDVREPDHASCFGRLASNRHFNLVEAFIHFVEAARHSINGLVHCLKSAYVSLVNDIEMAAHFGKPLVDSVEAATSLS